MIRNHFGRRIGINNTRLLFASLAFAVSAAAQQPRPIGWWKLQETRGRLAYDSSGNFQTGLIIGNVDIGQPGVIGHAYFFSVNGVGWVQVPYDALLSPATSEVTVAAWIKPTGENPSGQMAVVSNEGLSGSGLYGYGLRVINGLTTLQWCWAATGGPGNCAYGIIPFDPLNVWTHIAGTYDGTTLKEYVNGVLVQATDNSAFQHPLDTNQPLMIGRIPDPTHVLAWHGGIEDVRVYNQTLSATEIKLLTLTTTDQCKNGNWQTYDVFKDQGDCVSFVAADGKNPPGN